MAQVRTKINGTTQKGSIRSSAALAECDPSSESGPVRPPTSRRGDDRHSNCAVEAALGVIGGRWKGVVLYWLLGGKHRFGELRKRVPNCTERMLTLQLRELEEDGLVSRTVFPEVPPRVEYELTAFGRTLEPVLRGLRDWGERYKRRLG